MKFISDACGTEHYLHIESNFAHESSLFYVLELPSNYLCDTDILQQKTTGSMSVYHKCL